MDQPEIEADSVALCNAQFFVENRKPPQSETIPRPYESPALAIGAFWRNLQWKTVFKYPDGQSTG
jgi:hypothetical protein